MSAKITRLSVYPLKFTYLLVKINNQSNVTILNPLGAKQFCGYLSKMLKPTPSTLQCFFIARANIIGSCKRLHDFMVIFNLFLWQPVVKCAPSWKEKSLSFSYHLDKKKSLGFKHVFMKALDWDELHIKHGKLLFVSGYVMRNIFFFE